MLQRSDTSQSLAYHSKALTVASVFIPRETGDAAGRSEVNYLSVVSDTWAVQRGNISWSHLTLEFIILRVMEQNDTQSLFVSIRRQIWPTNNYA